MEASRTLVLPDTNEGRHERFGDLTSYLSLRAPRNFLEIFEGLDRNHPREEDIEKILAATTGSRFDFVGGGISGVMSAYVAGELSRLFDLEWDIHVWDKLEQTGYKSTKDSAARTRTSMFGSEMETIGNLATSIFFENMNGILQQGAREARVSFPSDATSGLHRCGYLWLWEDNKSYEAVTTNQELIKRLGLPSFILSPEEVADKLMPGINKDGFEFAYFCPTDAFVEPTTIVDTLTQYNAKVLGVQHHLRSQIAEIRVDTGKPISFTVLDEKTGESYDVTTQYLGMTSGACSKELGKSIRINGAHPESVLVRLKPVARQLTYVQGLTEEELNEHEPFTILMGKGAYWSRESPRSKYLIFGYARKADPEVPPERLFNPEIPGTDYFVDNMLLEGRLDGIHRDINLDSSRLKVVRSSGNLYGETVDGNYLVGRINQVNAARPVGAVAVNAAHNGHGIMASLKTAVHMVYRLTGIKQEESPILVLCCIIIEALQSQN